MRLTLTQGFVSDVMGDVRMYITHAVNDAPATILECPQHVYGTCYDNHIGK